MTTIQTSVGPVQVGPAPRHYSQEDLAQMDQAEQQLRAAGMDFTTVENATKNANLIGDHFQANPHLLVTVESIIRFVNGNNTSFLWRSPAQQRFDRVVAVQGAERGEQIRHYLAKQNQLVNTGEELYDNAAELLEELHGRPVDSANILNAIGRISAPTSRFDTRTRRQLHFVPQPKKQHYGHHSASDDANRKPGQFVTDANKTVHQYKAEILASQAQPSQDGDSAATISTAAQREAESLQGAYHSETAMIQRVMVFRPGTTETDWVKTLSARKNMQAVLTRQRETQLMRR